MGQMIRMRSYPAVDNHCCAAPNADTLYTIAWLDVAKEPWIFSIPDMGNRYYIMPILDGWSEVIFSAGSGTTGGKPQTYAITGPGWKGTLPAGVTAGQVADRHGLDPRAHLQQRYGGGLQGGARAAGPVFGRPAIAWGKPYTPSAATVDAAFDMKTAVRKQVNAMDVETYFTRLAELMKTNPPTAQDAPMVARMAKIGLVPGKDYDPSKLGSFDHEVLKAVPKLALLEMGVHLKRAEDDQRLAVTSPRASAISAPTT